MLAMVDNDNAGNLMPLGVASTIASMPQAGTRSYKGRSPPERFGYPRLSCSNSEHSQTGNGT